LLIQPNNREAMDAIVRKQLLSLAHNLGDERQMAILGEGNVSGCLDDEHFLVKASGTSLGTLTSEELVEVRSVPLLNALDGQTLMTDDEIAGLLQKVCADPVAPKPSVETLFHAWLLTLPGVQFVGHVHAIAVNQVLASPWAEKFAQERVFPDQVVYCGAMSVLVPYVDPGLVLAQHIRECVTIFCRETDRIPKTILLKNHGIIACGKSHTEVMAALAMAEKSAKVFVGAASLGGPVFMDQCDVERIAGRTDEHYRQAMLNR